MTEFEKKIIEQNEQILKNQETLIEMLHHSVHASGFSCHATSLYAFLMPYYKHHNMPTEHLEKLLEDEEEPHEKQSYEQEFQPIGSQSEEHY